MRAANRVALNTSILYLRMLVTTGITLYTTRVVLNVLGSTDYGLFNLVAGIVLMLSFLNTTMASSTQRFLSFYQGAGDLPMQKRVFSNSMLLHIAIAFIIVAALEITGLFLFDGALNIPADRIEATRFVYHFMAATVFFNVVVVPFNGALIAHENMIWVAVVNVIETLLKLGIALLLSVLSYDKLMVYGALTALVSVVSFLLYALYCLKKYDDCSLKGLTIQADKPLLKELSTFAGWNLFGTLCGLGRTQGLAVLLNIFLGAVINAAYGIANQVAAQLNFFSATLLRALNPQIMKSEGANDRPRMLRLAMMASKFGFFLLAIIAIPACFEMEAILTIWLKNVPPNTLIFCRLILIATLINQLTIGLQSAAQAIGDIKYYQIIVGTTLLLNLPIAYILLSLNYPAYSVIVSYAIIELIACILRMFFLRRLGGLSIRLYLRRVIYREIIPVAMALIMGILAINYIHYAHRFALSIPLIALTFGLSIYFFGLCTDEKVLMRNFIDKIKQKITS
ncbi:oligosaccharide flippase family protein [Olivibacter sp. XZL3]|uniref:oligosaccharide flippase family protein n=1 Tax=Olivibacter sp. XZL3 TaxID=1735116 RepID=UPI0010660986|nr:oligosaccharide flippase family protein [Olivibacter sp. XZL3]